MLDRVSSIRTRLRTVTLLAALSGVVLLPFQLVARTAHEPDVHVQASPAPASPQEPAAPPAPDARTVPQPAPSRVPVKPGQKSDDEPIRVALAEQQATMVRLQEALNALRQQVEALAARNLDSPSQAVRVDAEQLRATAEAVRLFNQGLAKRSEQQRTQLFLESQLSSLKAELEAVVKRSREISDQIQETQKLLEQVRTVKP